MLLLTALALSTTTINHPFVGSRGKNCLNTAQALRLTRFRLTANLLTLVEVTTATLVCCLGPELRKQKIVAEGEESLRPRLYTTANSGAAINRHSCGSMPETG